MCGGSASFRISNIFCWPPRLFATLGPRSLRSCSFSPAPLIWRWCKVKDHWRSSDSLLSRLWVRSRIYHPCILCLASGSKGSSPFSATAAPHPFPSFIAAGTSDLESAADVVWRTMRSEIQCIIMLSENMMMERFQAYTLRFVSLHLCVLH